MAPPPPLDTAAAATPPSPTTTTPPPPSRAEGLERRDRFLAFAFAAADLLVEADAAGRITFAAGAFRSRYGEAPEAFTGRHVSALVASEDRATLGIALQLLVARGRLAPLAIRLADRERTPFALAGLAPGGAGNGAAGAGRLCLTLGPVPSAPEATAAALASPEAFGREAEARLRAAVAGDGPDGARLLEGSLALLELGGAAGAAGAVLLARPELAQEVGGAIAADVGDALAGDLGAGRYGLLPGAAGDAPDLAALAARIESVLLAHGVPCAVAAERVPLRADGLTAVQAVRALRHALGAFEREGAAGLAGRGFAGGLAGCVQKVSARANALRLAVRQRSFDLGFQPIVDLATGEAHHHEALIRPSGGGGGGFASPAEFVLFAETVGLTEELDLAVAEAVLAQAATSEGPVACNLSGLSVQSATFRAALLARLDAAPPGAVRRLMVEVTESAEIEDEGAANETLDGLRARGVALCIDDFGAGAAAFRYLRSFRVDYVKVDGTYVRNAVRSERDRSFVAAMVDLSLAVGAKVIAERIETEHDARVMRDLGVHYGQGWLFGRPGPLPKRAPVVAKRQGELPERWGR